MNYILTIIVFILIFSLLILIHEFGHFIMAKRAGIDVEEFGFGLPPRIWGKKKGKTIYSINWIPFGGFVKMLGEDAKDSNMLRRKHSFVAQSIRARIKVVIAGVVMNFLLAWLLLTIGFSFGMQPLLAPDDVLPAVDSGEIQLIEGFKIKDMQEGGMAEKFGFKSNDIIFSVDGEVVDEFRMAEKFGNPAGVYKVVRNGEIYTYEITEEQLKDFTSDFESSLDFYEFVPFPRVRIFDLYKSSEAYKVGLRKGDFILSINGKQLYSVSDFEQASRGQKIQEYEVYRDGIREKFIIEFEQIRWVIISAVLPDSPAEKAGFKNGDVIVSVNGNNVEDSLELIDFVEQHSSDTLAYLIERDGKRLFYEVKPEEGKIGVFLSELMTYGKEQNMSVYNVSLTSSVVEVKEEKYPFYIAFYKSFNEGFRLAKLTGGMFLTIVADLIKSGEVPETVAGPVGIARLTYVFVQEGFIPLLRFVAILSLSLAVINILPFPALDGGRLLFIIIELIVGRRVNQKWESYIHAFGYFLILLLIFAVTYSDISRLINS